MTALIPMPGPAADPWAELKQFTAARIALGSTGVSVPVREVLRFKLAHAHARDAVYSSLEENQLAAGLARFSLPVLTLDSRARDRSEYLQRPDLGRVLSVESREQLDGLAGGKTDIAVVIADGLSAAAVNRHALPVLSLLLPFFEKNLLQLAPVCLVRQGRVAVGDEIGAGFGARLVLVMIGERPGLSSPDSMGVYLSFDPRAGMTDASRNCVSNIRPEGLTYEAAAGKISYLTAEALRTGQTGIGLKDATPTLLD